MSSSRNIKLCLSFGQLFSAWYKPFILERTDPSEHNAERKRLSLAGLEIGSLFFLSGSICCSSGAMQ